MKIAVLKEAAGETRDLQRQILAALQAGKTPPAYAKNDVNGNPAEEP